MSWALGLTHAWQEMHSTRVSGLWQWQRMLQPLQEDGGSAWATLPARRNDLVDRSKHTSWLDVLLPKLFLLQKVTIAQLFSLVAHVNLACSPRWLAVKRLRRRERYLKNNVAGLELPHLSAY